MTTTILLPPFRLRRYSLPSVLARHLSAVFNTCQSPPVMTRNSLRKPVEGKSVFRTNMVVMDEPPPEPDVDDIFVKSGTTTVAFLDEYYKIPTNIGVDLTPLTLVDTSRIDDRNILPPALAPQPMRR